MSPASTYTLGAACSQWRIAGGGVKVQLQCLKVQQLCGIILTPELLLESGWAHTEAEPTDLLISFPYLIFSSPCKFHPNILPHQITCIRGKKSTTGKGTIFNWIRLWNNLCPWVLLKTIKQPVSNYWSLISECDAQMGRNLTERSGKVIQSDSVPRLSLWEATAETSHCEENKYTWLK